MKMTFFDTENWREIGATLARNKTRTFLTAFGIFWGTAMLAMLWGGADGFCGIISRQFAGISTNLGGLSSGKRSVSYRGFNKGSSWNINENDLQTIRQVAPYIDKLTSLNFLYATASAGGRSKSAALLGVEPQYNGISQPVIYEGRFINESDMSANRKVAVIGKNIAADLFQGESPVGKGIQLDGLYFTIIGLAGQIGEASIGGRVDDSFILPATTMRKSFNMGTDVDFIIFSATDGHKPSDNEAAIRRAMSTAHTIDPNDVGAFNFMDITEIFDMINNLFSGIALLAIFVGGASLMAGVIGVGNIMWIVVKERTHEFGVRRALGARPADITVQILSESVMLTLVAGTAGVCFAALVLGIADTATADPLYASAGFQISFARATGIVATFLLLGSLAGTLPAVKAMKIKPIEALRTRA